MFPIENAHIIFSYLSLIVSQYFVFSAGGQLFRMNSRPNPRIPEFYLYALSKISNRGYYRKTSQTSRTVQVERCSTIKKLKMSESHVISKGFSSHVKIMCVESSQ